LIQHLDLSFAALVKFKYRNYFISKKNQPFWGWFMGINKIMMNLILTPDSRIERQTNCPAFAIGLANSCRYVCYVLPTMQRHSSNQDKAVFCFPMLWCIRLAISIIE
jgi:hypothetical protein